MGYWMVSSAACIQKHRVRDPKLDMKHKITIVALLSVIALFATDATLLPAQAVGDMLSSVTVSPAKPTLNTKLTATIAPSNATASYQWFRNGQAIANATTAAYKVTGADMCGQISVTATSGNVVTSKSVVPLFTDVPKSNTFYTAICWVAQNGITLGTGNGSTYSPTTAVNRGSMSAFIMRVLGSPAFTPPTTSPFVDLTPDHTFYKSITWMAAAGIAAGISSKEGLLYKASDPVNRGSMAQFLYRAAGSPQYTPPSVSPFKDVKTTDTFYKAINWLYDNGITVGVVVKGELYYQPDNAVNRASMAAFLKRFQARSAPAAPGACDNQPAFGAGQYKSFCPSVPGAKSYIWEIYTTADMKNVTTFTANKTSTTFSSLNEYATYYQTVRACDAKDGGGLCGSRSAVQAVTLEGKEWGIVHNFRIDSVSDTQVTVSWDHAAGATRYDLVVTNLVGGTILGTETVSASSLCPAKGSEDTPTTYTFNRADYPGLGSGRLIFVNVRGSRCASTDSHDSSPIFPVEFAFPRVSGQSFTATVLTFNTLKQSSADQDYDTSPLHGDLTILHSWDKRLPILASHANNADIVGVQEMGWFPGGSSRHYPAEFEAATGLALAMIPSQPQTPCSTYGNHIFYKAQKFTLTACGVGKLPSEDANFVSWAVLRDMTSGVSAFVVDAHTTLKTTETQTDLNQPTSDAELAMTQALINIINQANVNDLPVVMLGDLNATESTPGVNTMTVLAGAGYLNSRWISSARQYPNAYVPSRHAFAPVTLNKYSTSVDHVLVSAGIDVTNFRVRYMDPATAYTDHFAVEATITVH